VGDRVKLEIRSATFLRATMVGYLLPTVVFFAGVGAIWLLVPQGGTVLGLARDLASFVLGGAGVVATFVVLRIVGGRNASRRRYAPRIVSVSPGPGAESSR
jgi:positive regulator of sigma E activity